MSRYNIHESSRNRERKCPGKELLETIQEVIAPIRIDQINPANAERTCLGILNICLDIASSSVTQYPYGLTERFTQEEKDYYHKITAILTGGRTGYSAYNGQPIDGE